MASIRKRTWTSGGETRTAWVANYNDQGGKRHLKTFGTKKTADAWLVAARGEVAQGVHAAASASIGLVMEQVLPHGHSAATASDRTRRTPMRSRTPTMPRGMKIMHRMSRMP